MLESSPTEDTEVDDRRRPRSSQYDGAGTSMVCVMSPAAHGTELGVVGPGDGSGVWGIGGRALSGAMLQPSHNTGLYAHPSPPPPPPDC